LLFDENGLGDDRTDAARTQEAGERSDDMDEKNEEIGHLSILARTAIPQELWINQQFAIDTFAFGNHDIPINGNLSKFLCLPVRARPPHFQPVEFRRSA
jgi:hypothetical protein